MKNKNFKLLLTSNSIAYFAFQLIGPFMAIFLNQIGGGIENLGMLYGVSLLFNSVASFYVGKFSDKIGRKPFLVISSILSSVFILGYLYVKNLSQLYVLQAVYGINNAAWSISEQAFLADITKKRTRGKMIGIYNLILGILMSIGLMIGGMLIGKFGFKIIFYSVSILNLISVIFLVMINEKK